MRSVRYYRDSVAGASARLACIAVLGSFAFAACTQQTQQTQPPSRIAAPAPRAQPGDALSEQFKKAVEALPTGELVYNVPSSMSVGKSQIIGVVISQKFAPSIQHELTRNGPTALSSVRIASSMKAFLVATPSSAFTINPQQNDSVEQIPDPDGRIAWSWEVLPVRAGESELDIAIEAGVQVRGESERFFRTVKRVEMRVTAKPIPAQVLDIVTANWQWFLSTLLLPFGIWGFRQLAARSKQRTPSA